MRFPFIARNRKNPIAILSICMSVSDRDWILVSDDLEDAQSVSSIIFPEDAIQCESSGDMPQVSPTDDPLHTHQKPLRSDGLSGNSSHESDRLVSALACLVDWVSSALYASGGANSEGGVIHLSNQTKRKAVTGLPIIADHHKSIMPYLGRKASARLRAGRLIGSLYTPDYDLLVEEQRRRQRAALVGVLIC
jgi:hypothetical protein